MPDDILRLICPTGSLFGRLPQRGAHLNSCHACLEHVIFGGEERGQSVASNLSSEPPRSTRPRACAQRRCRGLSQLFGADPTLPGQSFGQVGEPGDVDEHEGSLDASPQRARSLRSHPEAIQRMALIRKGVQSQSSPSFGGGRVDAGTWAIDGRASASCGDLHRWRTPRGPYPQPSRPVAQSGQSSGLNPGDCSERSAVSTPARRASVPTERPPGG
jgi:hypothetical protein